MITEFLKKYQEELITEKIEIKEDYDLLLSKIKENEKFLSLLEEENNNLFSEFTPREVSYKHRDKMEEIKKTIDSLKNDKVSVESKILYIENRIKEIEVLLDDNTEEEKIIKTSTNDKLKNNLQNICAYLMYDPVRAKIELQDIISKM